MKMLTEKQERALYKHVRHTGHSDEMAEFGMTDEETNTVLALFGEWEEKFDPDSVETGHLALPQ